MLLASGALVAVLFVINMLPSLAHKDYAMRYGSVEEAGKAVGLNSLPVPTYFPEGISWPPSFIAAQKKPFAALVIEFNYKISDQTALVISQASLAGSELHLQRIKMSEIRQQSRYNLKGRAAMLQVGLCGDGMSCSRMSWEDKGNFISVLLMSTPFELIKITESIVR